MSSKITCTCGHSWSKSSSSKKDVNVCHICGKDNTMKDGGWLSKYAAEGDEIEKKPQPLLNLTDLTYTPMELSFLNDVKNGYCPTGNCLESSRKAYDMTAGRIKGIAGSNDIWTKDLNLISTPGTPSEKLVKENPYFKGDVKSGSADSWDIHGAIVKAGGKNIYSGASKQIIPTDIPTGAVAGWGPAGTRGTTHKERSQGMNTQFGLQPSHHSTEAVGYDDNGKPIFYDSFLRKYGTLDEIGKELKTKLGYELENISVPKSVAANTRENLNKKGVLKNELTPFSANIDKLLSVTKQPWAQINEDGELRSPNADKEKLSKFAQALTDNKGELVSSLGLSNSEYDRLANSALAIAMTESEGGGALGFSDRFGSTKGMTQLNIDNIKKDDRLKTALSKKYKGDGAIWNLQDPYNSAIATMMYLSVADKDAKRLYNKGLKPGTKTVNQPGFIENFRSTNSKLNKDGLFIDELNKRIPYSQIPGYEDGDITKVNNYLKQLTKSDRYSFVNKDDDLSLKLKTKGNNPKLTDTEKLAYMWQSPNSLKTGDAEGKSEYVNKIKNYYDALTKFNDGGPIQPNYNDASVSVGPDYVGTGYDITGRNYSPAWGGQFAMGGSLPGAAGHFYARYEDGGSMPGDVDFSFPRTKNIPSNGPYAKKTKASAQNGQEMKFYQEGLDWNPKSISKNGAWLSKYEEGGVIEDDRGQWDHPGEITKINSNEITMQGVDYPVLGISDTGDTQMMQPGEDYTYDGKSVTEYPMMKEGKWLSKYDTPKAQRGIITGKDLTSVADNTRVQKGPANNFEFVGQLYAQQEFKKAKEFHNDWMNSPMYQQMINKSDPINANAITNQRKKNIENIKFTYSPIQEDLGTGAYSNSNTGDVTILPYGVGIKGLGTHELSHSIDRPKNNSLNRMIPQSDINKIEKFTKGRIYNNSSNSYSEKEFDQYVNDPTETRARLNDIRQQSFENKLYNPFKEKVTPEIYDKLLKNYFDNRSEGGKNNFISLEQLRETYRDEQIRDLLNTVSKNNKNPLVEDELPKAQAGGRYDGTLDFKSLVPATVAGGLAASSSNKKNGGWLNKYN